MVADEKPDEEIDAISQGWNTDQVVDARRCMPHQCKSPDPREVVQSFPDLETQSFLQLRHYHRPNDEQRAPRGNQTGDPCRGVPKEIDIVVDTPAYDVKGRVEHGLDPNDHTEYRVDLVHIGKVDPLPQYSAAEDVVDVVSLAQELIVHVLCEISDGRTNGDIDT